MGEGILEIGLTSLGQVVRSPKILRHDKEPLLKKNDLKT